MPDSLTLIALPGMPEVHPGDDLAALIIAVLETSEHKLQDDDVVVVAQKVVSKAEGRYVDLAKVAPTSRARGLAQQVGKDPRLVEVILRESKRVVRRSQDVLIVEHWLGVVVANAGVDRSNVDPAAGAEPVLLLPRDPDVSAGRLHEQLSKHFGVRIGVIVNDSFGRAWRLGTVGVALGVAGLPALLDLRGRADLHGRALRVSETAFADEIAAAASLLMGQADEGRPVVVARGLSWSAPALPALRLVRPPEDDLFR